MAYKIQVPVQRAILIDPIKIPRDFKTVEKQYLEWSKLYNANPRPDFWYKRLTDLEREYIYLGNFCGHRMKKGFCKRQKGDCERHFDL